MLTLPLVDHKDVLVGVMQVLNKSNEFSMHTTRRSQPHWPRNAQSRCSGYA